MVLSSYMQVSIRHCLCLDLAILLTNKVMCGLTCEICRLERRRWFAVIQIVNCMLSFILECNVWGFFVCHIKVREETFLYAPTAASSVKGCDHLLYLRCSRLKDSHDSSLLYFIGEIVDKAYTAKASRQWTSFSSHLFFFFFKDDLHLHTWYFSQPTSYIQISETDCIRQEFITEHCFVKKMLSVL